MLKGVSINPILRASATRLACLHHFVAILRCSQKITSYILCICCGAIFCSRLVWLITSHLATVFWWPSGMASWLHQKLEFLDPPCWRKCVAIFAENDMADLYNLHILHPVVSIPVTPRRRITKRATAPATSIGFERRNRTAANALSASVNGACQCIPISATCSRCTAILASNSPRCCITANICLFMTDAELLSILGQFGQASRK